MSTFADYEIVEELHKSQSSSVSRVQSKKDQTTYIAKILNSPSPSALELAGFRHEVRILQQIDVPGAPEFYKVIDEPGNRLILTKDFKGIPLDKVIQSKNLSFIQQLRIAIGIAEVLHKLHEQQMIHKDIKPSNILIKPKSLEVEIIDFGIAASKKIDVLAGGLNLTEGTLQYMSPEQTGRINLAMDHRTDLYSFGVLLYEVATGRLPFTGSDALELVHAHLAVVPETPQSVNPAVPTAYSELIMKLLSKSPDERYRTAAGLAHDLEVCEKEYYSRGRISSFTLGKQDFLLAMELPKRLYARKAELKILTEAYERSKEGLVRVFIKGEAGVGKSALVNELKRYAINERSYFLEGKFDQYNTGVAYSGILSMLSSLIDQVLRESDEKLNQFADTLKDRLGANIGLMVELLPNLKHIVGEVPEIPELTAKENESRFKLTFRAFIQTFTGSDKSIVAFIDDMQWADPASLKLLHWLAKNSTGGSLLMLYSYRPEGITDNPSFSKWMIDMFSVSRDTEEIDLGNLLEADVVELMSDLLQSDALGTKIAKLIYSKTAGNPFFIIEMLRAMKDRELVVPKKSEKSMTWYIDEEAINKLDFAKNVINLILERFGKISDHCADLLRTASCINNTFSLKNLEALKPEISRGQFSEYLGEAMSNELIYPVNENYKFVGLEDIDIDADYAFIHDRVQQVIYSSLSEENLEDVHFKLATTEISVENPSLEQAMELANHIVKSISRFRDNELSIPAAVALVNAAKKAKENNSPKPAFLETALDLLPENAWEIMPELAFGAHILIAESYFLQGQNEQAEEWYNVTEKNAGNVYQKAISICLKMVLYIYSARFEDSINEGNRALQMLGYQLPNATEENIGASIGAVMHILGDKDVDSLVDLEQVKEEHYIILNNIMSVYLPSAFLAGNGNLWTLSVLEMTKLLLEHGLTVGGALGLSSFGMIMGSVIGDKQKAHRIGKVALAITDKLNDHSRDAQLKFVRAAFLSTWVKDNFNIQKILDSSMHDGLQFGDLPYIGYSFQVKLGVSVYMSSPLNEILEIIDAHKTLISTLGQPDTMATMNTFHDLIAQENALEDYDYSSFHFDQRLGELMENKMYQSAGLSIHLRCVMALIHREYDKVVAYHETIKLLEQSFFSNILMVSQRTIYAIAKTQLALQGHEDEKEQILEEIKGIQAQLKTENQSGSAFFLNCESAINAMVTWLEEGEDAAVDAIEETISMAQETSFFRNSALFSEFLSRIFHKRNRNTLAKAYLSDALRNYVWYGASSKIKMLRQEFHHLIDEAAEPSTFSQATTSILMDTHLDYLSIIKSSQVLSAETDIDKLLQEFLLICQQNAGAQRGLVFLINEGLHVKASFGYEDGKITYPEQFIKFTQRTSELTSSGNAVEDERLAFDPFFIQNEIRSLIAVPIKYKGNIRGIIYLENNLNKGVFSKGVQELLFLLSNQIAISIDNAALYNSLEESNRTLELKVQERTSELSNLYAENEQLLLNMLPPDIAQRLKEGETYISDLHNNVTVFFTDVVNFTQISEKLTPKELVEQIHDMFKSFDEVIEKYEIEKIKTIGDAYLAVSGITHDADNHAEIMVKAAKEIVELVEERKKNNGLFSIRIGIASGPVVAGVVGVKKFAFDIWGDTVNTAARMEEYSESGKINISGSTFEQVKDAYNCSYRGKIEAKNKGEIDMYYVD